MGIAVSYHDRVTKLQGPLPANAGPFDSDGWFALLGEAGAKVLIAEAREGDRAVSLALQRGEGCLEALANWFSFTWRPRGRDAALLAAIARDLRGRAPCIVLAPLPDEDGSATLLETAFRAGGWWVTREPCDENHVLAVAGRSFDDYWASRPGKMRTTLKRKAGKVEVSLHRTFDAAAWADYRTVYAQSWKPQEERADVLEAFARAEGAAGRLRLGIARAGGEPVAAQFWTVENGAAYIHKLAHVEAAKPLSAGTTLSAALFRHAIDVDRVALVDFGTGSDGYKRDWMEEMRPRWRLTCLDWRRPAAWPRIARRLARRWMRR